MTTARLLFDGTPEKADEIGSYIIALPVVERVTMSKMDGSFLFSLTFLEVMLREDVGEMVLEMDKRFELSPEQLVALPPADGG